MVRKTIRIGLCAGTLLSVLTLGAALAIAAAAWRFEAGGFVIRH
jgi:hypothetical protein